MYYRLKIYLFNFLLFWAAFLLPSMVLGIEKPMAPQTLPGAVIVDAEQAAGLILSLNSMIVLDSRKVEEYQKGHIEGAVSLPDIEMQRSDFERRFTNKNAPFLIYCNGLHCLRSSNALKKLGSWGYTKLYWLRGGWHEWIDKGLPIAH